MKQVVSKIANIITSLGAVIFVLLMTIGSMILLSHGLYFQIFSKTMVTWQAEAASWILACGVETTVLIVTCNTEFLNKKLPIFLAICSGIIVLFFIEAFDTSQSTLDLSMRWFVGGLVALLNFIYSELFYKKLMDANANETATAKLQNLQALHNQLKDGYEKVKAEEKETREVIVVLERELLELREFREKELQKLTCPSCKVTFESVYKLTSHRNTCLGLPNQRSPLNGAKSLANHQ
jgi:hypothetical protein